MPDWITNHDEGDVDDPVAVSQALNNQLSSAGIAARPLSANEYQPADRQTAGVTAWYLARFAQSGYTNAMRGNWVCCMTPNLTGVLTQTGGTWTTSGNWWAMRTYADMTGTLVNTSGQVGIDRDLGLRGQHHPAGRRHHRRQQRLHRHRDGDLQRPVGQAAGWPATAASTSSSTASRTRPRSPRRRWSSTRT